MARLIDANDLTRWLQMVLSNENPLDRKARAAFSEVLARVSTMPGIDAVPVVHAKWVDESYGYRNCSKCGCEHPLHDANGFLVDDDYCPECGAKMDEPSP